MKTQKCYSLDDRVLGALELMRTRTKKPFSSLVEKYVVQGIENDVQRVQDENVRAAISERLESYKEHSAG